MQSVQCAGFGDLIPLSCKGQWQKKHFNVANVNKNVAIRELSYEIIFNFACEINNKDRWKSWERYLEMGFKWLRINKTVTWKSFVQTMIDRKYKLDYLSNIANKLHDSASFKNCFYQKNISEDVALEKDRVQASCDTSRGYFIDLSYETIIEIDDLIEDESPWRKMGDGLGFNLHECFEFSDPIEMFEKWILKFNDGTVSRIYFEAKRLGFSKVCEYLDHIPLQKMSVFVPRDPHSLHPALRFTTVFDLEKLDKIYALGGMQIDWIAVSHLVFNSFDSKIEDIWLSGDVTLARLNEAMNQRHKDSSIYFDQFMADVHSGVFQPSNLEGVTYNQIACMAEAIECDSNMTQKQFIELMDNNIGNSDFRGKELSIREVLCIYWQLNRELDLTQVFNKLSDRLMPTAPFTAQILSWKYDLMKPMRVYLEKPLF